GRRHMDAVLPGILAMPLYLAVEVGDGKGLGKVEAAVAFDPLDDLVGRRLEIRSAAMAIECEFLAMSADRRHDRFRGRLAGIQGRGRQDAAHDHARVHVPGLRLQTQLDGEAVLPGLVEQRVELAEGLHRKRAGRFQERLEDGRAVAPDERIGAPIAAHGFSSVRYAGSLSPSGGAATSNVLTTP